MTDYPPYTAEELSEIGRDANALLSRSRWLATVDAQAARIKQAESEREAALAARDAARADLDRLSQGTWSKELARLSAVNAELRARAEQAESQVQKLEARVKELEAELGRLG